MSARKDEGLYLADIAAAIRKIEQYMGNLSREEFIADDLRYDAVLRQLTILGEAAAQLSTAFKLQHSEIPWAKITGLRNRLMHEYANVDSDIVWDTYVHSLPELKRRLEKLL